MEGSDVASWRKSSYGGSCVEAGSAPGAVPVRDTRQAGHGPVLQFSASAWRAFGDQVKQR